jgi:protein TonB
VRFTELAIALVACAVLASCAPSRPRVPQPAPEHRPSASPPVTLPAPPRARNWDEFRRQAALRLVAANPQHSYTGAVPEPLLAIPVLEIELERDGHVRHIKVLRYPTQALDTVQIAIDAVRRAEPFGDVSRLPRPWTFAEVFLFDDDRRFKPRTLDGE